METIHSLSQKVLKELETIFTQLSSQAAEHMCDEIAHARRIACYGVGREGLMVKALCMRLMHLGLDAHVVGDMTTPPIGKGDLLIVSAGPGKFSTVLALMDVAKQSGARSMVITAQRDGEAARRADVIIHLPAQTMASDLLTPSSVLPMGSLYEISQLIFFDLISILLREKLGQTLEEMRDRHTNLE
jgi:6-phospho-3-hexuloisomerase